MRVSLLALSALLLNSTVAWGASIRLSALGDSCLVIPAPPGSGTFVIEALGVYYPDCGYSVAGTLFRVAGLPQGWTASVTPNSQAGTFVGNLFGDGVRIDFTIWPPANPLLLYSVTLSPPAPGATAILRVETTIFPPPLANLTCPALFGSECIRNPYVLCLARSALYVNSESCVVGVAPRTWSQVKRLYD